MHAKDDGERMDMLWVSDCGEEDVKVCGNCIKLGNDTSSWFLGFKLLKKFSFINRLSAPAFDCMSH